MDDALESCWDTLSHCTYPRLSYLQSHLRKSTCKVTTISHWYKQKLENRSWISAKSQLLWRPRLRNAASKPHLISHTQLLFFYWLLFCFLYGQVFLHSARFWFMNLFCRKNKRGNQRNGHIPKDGGHSTVNLLMCFVTGGIRRMKSSVWNHILVNVKAKWK